MDDATLSRVYARTATRPMFWAHRIEAVGFARARELLGCDDRTLRRLGLVLLPRPGREAEDLAATGAELSIDPARLGRMLGRAGSCGRKQEAS